MDSESTKSTNLGCSGELGSCPETTEVELKLQNETPVKLSGPESSIEANQHTESTNASNEVLEVRGESETPQTAVVETSQRSYSTRSTTKQDQKNVVVHPRLKPVFFKTEVKPLKLPSLFAVSNTKGIAFFNTEEQPLNRRGYKYKECEIQPLFTSNLYSTTELPPYNVHPSYFDRAAGIIFSENMEAISTTDGWRSIRSNVGIREGSYYFEFNIINANNTDDNSHVRVGIARKEAALEAPVGFDGYGYGLRDVYGQKVTLSRPKEFMRNAGENGFSSGDVIGILVELPSLKDQRRHLDKCMKEKDLAKNSDQIPERKKKKFMNSIKSSKQLRENENIFRDQVPIKYKGSLYYEQFEYTATKKMDHLLNPVTVFGESAIIENTDDDRRAVPVLEGSKMVVFKNGKKIGTAFENLFAFLPSDDDLVDQLSNPEFKHTDDGQLGYYPMISVYQHGVVSLNSGPSFAYPVAEASHAKPLSNRYNDTIVEEYLWDIIDEVEAQYLDSFDE